MLTLEKIKKNKVMKLMNRLPNDNRGQLLKEAIQHSQMLARKKS